MSPHTAISTFRIGSKGIDPPANNLELTYAKLIASAAIEVFQAYNPNERFAFATLDIMIELAANKICTDDVGAIRKDLVRGEILATLLGKQALFHRKL